MPKIIMDDGTTFDVGRFAGYRGNASEKNGEPFCLLSLDFEVTGRQLGEYTQQLHTQITAGWDAEREKAQAAGRERLQLLQELESKAKAGGTEGVKG